MKSEKVCKKDERRKDIKPPKGYVFLRARQHAKAGDLAFRGKFGRDDWVGVMPVHEGFLVKTSLVARKV